MELAYNEGNVEEHIEQLLNKENTSDYLLYKIKEGYSMSEAAKSLSEMLRNTLIDEILDFLKKHGYRKTSSLISRPINLFTRIKQKDPTLKDNTLLNVWESIDNLKKDPALQESKYYKKKELSIAE